MSYVMMNGVGEYTELGADAKKEALKQSKAKAIAVTLAKLKILAAAGRLTTADGVSVLIDGVTAVANETVSSLASKGINVGAGKASSKDSGGTDGGGGIPTMYLVGGGVAAAAVLALLVLKK